MIRIWCNCYPMEPKLVPLWILLASTSFVAPFQYVFEGCKLSEATVLAESTLRVRKLNRTAAGLYGNFTLKLDLDESFTTSIQPFHSPLGNNQFNRYPMKVGPVGLRDFMDKFWADYHPFFAKYVLDIPSPGECPISARTMVFNDMQLAGELFPPYVPTGLWKLEWTMESGEVRFQLEILIKVYEDGYF